MHDADCRNIVKVKEWYDVLNKTLHNEIGRSVIETLDITPWLINKVGLKIWFEFEKWARPKYMSALYKFLCYLLPSKEERNNEFYRTNENISDEQQQTLFNDIV
jgi:hypothetical protein